jgi:hypothetical protein
MLHSFEICFLVNSGKGRTSMNSKFHVEIRASDRSWFLADSDVKAPMSAEAADLLVAKLREQGFEARGRLVD